jgi:hypothetical protein
MVGSGIHRGSMTVRGLRGARASLAFAASYQKVTVGAAPRTDASTPPAAPAVLRRPARADLFDVNSN